MDQIPSLKRSDFIPFVISSFITIIGFTSFALGICSVFNYNFHHKDCELLTQGDCSINCNCVWCQDQNKCLDLNFITNCKSTTNIYDADFDCSKNPIIIWWSIFSVWILGFFCCCCRLLISYLFPMPVPVDIEKQQIIRPNIITKHDLKKFVDNK